MAEYLVVRIDKSHHPRDVDGTTEKKRKEQIWDTGFLPLTAAGHPIPC